MTRQKPDRKALLNELSAHVLGNGLHNASLRPLAAAAGTSDRMLIYHFGSKEALIAEVLEYLASQLSGALDQAIPLRRFETEEELVETALTFMRAQDFLPYTRVWLEIVAEAARGNGVHKTVGHAIIQTFLEWIAARHPRGNQGASRALVLIEGSLVFDAVGHQP